MLVKFFTDPEATKAERVHLRIPGAPKGTVERMTIYRAGHLRMALTWVAAPNWQDTVLGVSWWLLPALILPQAVQLIQAWVAAA